MTTKEEKQEPMRIIRLNPDTPGGRAISEQMATLRNGEADFYAPEQEFFAAIMGLAKTQARLETTSNKKHAPSPRI